MTPLLEHDGAYLTRGCDLNDALKLKELGWAQHPRDSRTWFTRSPYLAAPFPGAAAIPSLSTYAWNYETSFAKGPIDNTPIRLPKGETPYQFQIAGIQRALRQERIMICDEPGCGKTPQSLAIINHLRPKRVLIGCRTFLVDNWAAECEKWLVDAQPITLLDGAKKILPDTGIIILPYSRGHTFHRAILSGPPIDYLIGDEFHALKDPNARRSIPWLGAEGFARKAKRLAFLTGTPMPNNPIEMHAPLSVVAPDIMRMSRDRFQQTYCQTIQLPVEVHMRNGHTRKIKVEKVVARGQKILNAELRASGVMIRRLKIDVLDQLPAKNQYFVHLHPSEEIENLTREESDLFDQLTTRLLTAQELFALKGHVAEVRRKLGALKAPKIAEYVKWLFDQGESQCVLFMLHLDAIEIVRRAFENTGVKTFVLTGAESPKKRYAHVQEFQAGASRGLVIGQITASGEGLTMTRSRFAVLGEISWTPGVNDQAIDRVHRITQTRQVDAPVLTFPHAVEERVIRLNARKALDSKEVLDINLRNLLAA